MFESVVKFFRRIGKKEQEQISSKDTAKERLHLVLMQDRANVSADFLDMMKQEIIEVIKKYIDVDEKDIDVRLTNKTNEDGTTGAPALYANIPITGIKQEVANASEDKTEKKQEVKEEENIEKEDKKEKVEQETQKVEDEKEEPVKAEEVKVEVDEVKIEEKNVEAKSKKKSNTSSSKSNENKNAKKSTQNKKKVQTSVKS